LKRLAVSLDGPDAETHDAFRRVRGSYRWTMRIIEAANGLGLPLQINTTVGRLTYPHLEAMAHQLRELPVTLWAVFFLIAIGRGAALDQITAQECERVLELLHDLAPEVSFGIKTTEAPHYFRIAAARRTAAGQERTPARRLTNQVRAHRAVNDGNGFVFIDHVGRIQPSGFLPMACGSVRTDSLVRTYRQHELFLGLRDPDRFLGKCGRCEFRHICGGSRARAYAATGSPFASDPLCAYEPQTPPAG
jgi:radical SAM protein with 4Fe4S-binding SPASM domain